ncbi:MAG TPA: sulfite exporter TauE/SafE family protein [Egicoccus sp.]|nr:sulfite exporter TauE/SafE family protein [Egicoccus sp.]HSK24057.1 sulfite exporter TauE/SafE family protein [Egicoccus sp.]
MPELVLVALILFAGALTRAFLGFGDAVVAMPLLALAAVDLQLAVPVVGLGGVLITLMTVRPRMDVERGILGRLLAGTLVGLPVGVLLVTRLPERPLKATLGVMLLAYGVTMLLRPHLRRRLPARWATAFGIAAGALGGAYNLNGVPVAVFGTLQNWDPERFRGTLQAYFGVSSLLVALGQGAGGLWSWEVARLLAVAAPGMLLAMPLGRALHRRVTARAFLRAVFGTIALLGLVLLRP